MGPEVTAAIRLVLVYSLIVVGWAKLMEWVTPSRDAQIGSTFGFASLLLVAITLAMASKAARK